MAAIEKSKSNKEDEYGVNLSINTGHSGLVVPYNFNSLTQRNYNHDYSSNPLITDAPAASSRSRNTVSSCLKPASTYTPRGPNGDLQSNFQPRKKKKKSQKRPSYNAA